MYRYLHAVLKRIAPYCDGRASLEEIMWQENIKREDLTAVMAFYRDVLVKITHEWNFQLHHVAFLEARA